MKEIWVPMDSGVVVVDLKEKGTVEITDQIAMEKRPVAGTIGFKAAYKPPKRPKPKK